MCLVSSRGGHLYQLFLLKSWWCKYSRFWITGKGSDTESLLDGEKIYYGFFPESRNLLNAIRNFILGLKLINKEKPDLLVSCGAGIAPPIFLAGKLLGCKTLFLDSISFVKYPSLSAKIVSLFANVVLTQHKDVVNKLKNSEYWGEVL